MCGKLPSCCSPARGTQGRFCQALPRFRWIAVDPVDPLAVEMAEDAFYAPYLARQQAELSALRRSERASPCLTMMPCQWFRMLSPHHPASSPRRPAAPLCRARRKQAARKTPRRGAMRAEHAKKPRARAMCLHVARHPHARTAHPRAWMYLHGEPLLGGTHAHTHLTHTEHHTHTHHMHTRRDTHPRSRSDGHRLAVGRGQP